MGSFQNIYCTHSFNTTIYVQVNKATLRPTSLFHGPDKKPVLAFVFARVGKNQSGLY